ncbi:hypothetical protein QBC39DRAFT_379663 [Podospora conica]|nr:hypothetical protein QBC39DRAFT_379663 [Schizothecium conicum]
MVSPAELPANAPDDDDDNDSIPDATSPQPAPPPSTTPEVGEGEPAEPTPPPDPSTSDPDRAHPLSPGEHQQQPAEELPAAPSHPPSHDATSTTSTSRRNRPKSPPSSTPTPTPAEINKTAALLRRVFSLRLQVWALEGAHALDRPVQRERARRADELLAEVKGVVEGWMAQERGWTGEEWGEVVRIAGMVGELEGGLSNWVD